MSNAVVFNLELDPLELRGVHANYDAAVTRRAREDALPEAWPPRARDTVNALLVALRTELQGAVRDLRRTQESRRAWRPELDDG